jgi:hypothetical protein
MAKTQLVGNSHVSEMQRDKITGAITGFDIINPNNTKLHIDLSLYSKTSQTVDSADKLKEAVYKNYEFLAEHVPAATAVFENNVKMFPKGVVWAGPQVPGLWADAVGKGVEINEKDAKVKELSTKLGFDMKDKALMTGNLKLPTGAGPIETAGGGTHEDALAQDYLGKDRKWHKQTPQEALMHEHAHLVPELQNFHTISELRVINPGVPPDNLKDKTRLENEGKAIEFVNQVMMKPVGIPERDPDKYREVKPADIEAPARTAYNFMDLESLHQGPIPKSLSTYSQPVAQPVKLNGKLYGDNSDNSHAAELITSALHYVRDTLPTSQQAAVYAQLAERAKEASNGVAAQESSQNSV